MTAPTEDEIRDAFFARQDRDPSTSALESIDEAITYAFDTVGLIELNDDRVVELFESDLWTDLRPSQVVKLNEIINEAKMTATDAMLAAILENVIAAGLAFAAEYPDAPRATREAVPA